MRIISLVFCCIMYMHLFEYCKIYCETHVIIIMLVVKKRRGGGGIMEVGIVNILIVLKWLPLFCKNYI